MLLAAAIDAACSDQTSTSHRVAMLIVELDAFKRETFLRAFSLTEDHLCGPTLRQHSADCHTHGVDHAPREHACQTTV
jgi:hypothetical protein